MLQRVDAFITHGGMNSVHKGLHFGLPVLLIPHQLEQLFNARTAAARGAGIALEEQVVGRQVETGALRRALDQLLAEPGYRQAAGEVQESLQATGGIRGAADGVQALLTHGQAANRH